MSPARGRRNTSRLIPVNRLRPIVDEWVEAYERERPQGYGARLGNDTWGGALMSGAIQALAFRSGVNQRQIWTIRAEAYPSVMFTTADKLLIGMDREYLWHFPPELGGLSDYYQDEPPPLQEKTPEQEERLSRGRDRRARRTARQKAQREQEAA